MFTIISYDMIHPTTGNPFFEREEDYDEYISKLEKRAKVYVLGETHDGISAKCAFASLTEDQSTPESWLIWTVREQQLFEVEYTEEILDDFLEEHTLTEDGIRAIGLLSTIFITEENKVPLELFLSQPTFMTDDGYDEDYEDEE